MGSVAYLGAMRSQNRALADAADKLAAEGNARCVAEYLSRRLKEALDTLASEVWGATGPARGRVTGFGSDAEGDALASIRAEAARQNGSDGGKNRNGSS